MPTLLRRSNGIFYYVHVDEAGRRRWVSTGQRSRQLALEHIRGLNSSKPRIPCCSLSEFSEDLLLHLRIMYAPGTVAIYRKSLYHFLEATGNVQLTVVTPRHIDAFTARRLQEVGPVTVGIELRSLRAAFYTALRWELIERNPFSGVRLPRTEEQVSRFLSRADLARLHRHAGIARAVFLLYIGADQKQSPAASSRSPLMMNPLASVV